MKSKQGKTPFHRRAQKISKLEGKKVPVSMGNILEVLAREEDLMAEELAKESFRDDVWPAYHCLDSKMFSRMGKSIEKKADVILKQMIKAKKGRTK
jgi:hypothetical protein